MLLATLSLALLANQPEAPRTAFPRAERVARTSVQIISAEEIRFDESPKVERGKRQQFRQHRRRDGMPMVEFY